MEVESIEDEFRIKDLEPFAVRICFEGATWGFTLRYAFVEMPLVLPVLVVLSRLLRRPIDV